MLLANLVPELERQGTAGVVEEVLAGAGEPLAAREVAAVREFSSARHASASRGSDSAARES